MRPCGTLASSCPPPPPDRRVIVYGLRCRVEDAQGADHKKGGEREVEEVQGRPAVDVGYRDTSLVIKRIPLGPYRRPMPRVVGVI